MTDYAAKQELGINPPKTGAFTEVRWIKRLPQRHERNRTDVLYPCVHPVQLKQVPVLLPVGAVTIGNHAVTSGRCTR